jgi:hypothetical protein
MCSTPAAPNRKKAAWGFHYADVSAELATIWHFPDALVTALRSVPDPLGAGRLDRAAWVHLGAWAARVTVLSLEDEAAGHLPGSRGQEAGVDPAWMPVLVKHAPDKAERAMPSLTELAAGLDAMLE